MTGACVSWLTFLSYTPAHPPFRVAAGTPLTAKEKAVHDKGLVSILQQLHAELDAALLDAYGWQDLAGTALRSGPANESPLDSANAPEDKDYPILTPCAGPPGGRSLPDDALLTRLVTINHERATEEKRGLIRYLLPDYQNPGKFSDDRRQLLQGELTGAETPKLPEEGEEFENRQVM